MRKLCQGAAWTLPLLAALGFAGLHHWRRANAIPGVAMLPVSHAPKILHATFVLVGGPHADATPIDRAHYESVLRRTAMILERESLNRLRLDYAIVELDAAALALPDTEYGHRTFEDWYAALRPHMRDGDDVLVFAPDRQTDWCTDAHSMGFMMGATRFVCLEPAGAIVSSDLLVHKIFHTFGFFHQQARNKQYRLLSWEIGLPGFAYAMDVVPAATPAGDPARDFSFFSPLALAAVGLPIGGFESCHLDGRLRCAPGTGRGECADVIGPACRDADHDGILDLEDGYPLSPPRAGPDSDGDGIPDGLDLCPATSVSIDGSGVHGGPLDYWIDEPALVSLSAISPDAEIDSIAWAPATASGDKALGDLLFFDDAQGGEAFGASIDVPVRRAAPVRVRIAYRYRGQPVQRSVYVYARGDRTAPGPWGYVNEKEWFYFNRFGCDMPVDLDLYDTSQYDADADGLPDERLSVFPANRANDYDWDGDGVPDRDDTLPTVAGSCANRSARGVRDSDGDGLCDPGHLSYSPLPAGVPRGSYFGEMMIDLTSDPDFDRCPFLPGPRETNGCPFDRDAGPW